MSNNTRYKIMQGTYWMVYCLVVNFRIVFLNGRGMGTTEIGVITAVFGIIAALIQPVLGRLSDNDPKLTWRRMMIMLSLPMPIGLVLLMLVPGKLSAGIIMGVLYLLINASMPFMNSVPYYYERRGETINFGMARGMGSATYAALSLVVGTMAAKMGINVVPILSLIVFVGFVVNTRCMACEPLPLEEKAEGKHSAGMFRKYPAFTVMFIAVLVMMTSHNMTCTYLLQIIQELGGDSSHLGVAMAVQAVVELPVLFGYSIIRKHFRTETLMVVSGFGFFVKSLILLFSANVTMIYIAQLTQIFSFGIFASASVYFVTENVKGEDQTTGQAWMTATALVAGMVIGSLLGGYLFEHVGMRAMLICNSLFAAVTIPISAASAMLVRRNRA